MMIKFVAMLVIGIAVGVIFGFLMLPGQSGATKEMTDIVNAYSKYQPIFYCNFDIMNGNVTGTCQTGSRK